MKNRVITGVLVVFFLSGLAVVRFRLDAQAPPPVVSTIVFDPSGSQQRACGAEAALARSAFEQMQETGGTLR